MTRIVARLCVLVVSAAAGVTAARALEAPAAAGGALGALAGVVAVLGEALAASLPIERLFWGLAGGLAGVGTGLVLGLVAAALIERGQAAVVALAVVLGAYTGAAMALGRLADLSAISARLFPVAGRGRGLDKILDTSAIIDGRIADICGSGFLDGTLVVPGFVLRELQRIADSSDARKRNRGKRGFEVLARLQRLPGVRLEIAEVEIAGVDEVDRQLLELARRRGGKVVTNDYSLNKLAELAGVAVLNVNELASAVRSAVLPGEALTVQVLREGKEPGQGVAYLDDGTMIVIEQGKRSIGQAVDVVVMSVLQTPAGRMVFTRTRDDAPSAVEARERADA
ncbi:MAG: hypothetical protein AUH99_08175 [Candidatus Rokubacteria bacterium 13_2_20CM_2_70_11]|nr:MAG: hypothetical protein AUH99_08175 [Candidatus Rokubacteria bacterium 13_2_20CM_2_70_11]